MTQDCAKMALRWPKIGQDSHKMAQDWTKMGQDSSKMGQDWTKMDQDGGPKVIRGAPSRQRPAEPEQREGVGGG